MNIHLIDDDNHYISKTINSIDESVEIIYNDRLLRESLYDIAHQIKGSISQEGCKNDIIAISVHLTYQSNPRQKMMGIEILKFLRLVGIENHILLYSSLNLSTILRTSPKNTIILSEGTTYLQLPLDNTSLNFTQLSRQKCQESLKKYIRSEFVLPEQNRHYWANWFGIIRLWQVHKAVDTSFTSDYPEAITKELRKLPALQALYLFGHNPQELSNSLLTNENEIQDILEKEKIRLKEKQNELTGIEEDVASLEDLETILSKLGQSSFFGKTTFDVQAIKDYFDSSIAKIEKQADDAYEKNKLEKENISLLIEDKKQELEQINEVQKNAFKGVPVTRRKLRERNPKILLIDDQPGWDLIFPEIVYGSRESDNFKTIPCKLFKGASKLGSKEEQILELNQIYTKFIKKEISAFDPNLILLDLRLLNEKDIIHDLDNLSGMIVLNQIRADFKAIPILISTSSNKYYIYEAVTKLGKADAFWNKESLDDKKNEKESINNYCDLLHLIERLTGEEYNLLRYFSNSLKNLQETQDHWWENKTWPNKDFTTVNPTKIYKMLESGLNMYKSYLNFFVLKSYKDPYYQIESISALINRFNCIIEAIHGIDQSSWMSSKKKVSKDYNRNSISNGEMLGGSFLGRRWQDHRGDYIAQYLYNIRNATSHNHNIKIQFADLKLYIKIILYWLQGNYRKLNGTNYYSTKSWTKLKTGLRELVKINQKLPNNLLD